MKLQDYIHYYIGCDVLILDNERRTKLVGGDFVPNEINDIYYSLVEEDGFIMPYNEDADTKRNRIKPILRKLNDITDEECWEIDKIDSMWVPNTSIEYKTKRLYLYREKCMEFRNITPLVFDFLLKQQFDLFSLIENSLAIDSKTLK